MPKSRHIRVMHVVRSMGVGGTEEGVRKLLLGLDPSRFEQTVCTVLPSGPEEPRTGARQVSLQYPENRGGLLIPRLCRLLRREKPDIVHSRNWATIEAVPAARLVGIPAAIHSEHGLDVHSMHGQPWRRRVFRSCCYHWARQFFVVSESLRTYYAQQLRVLPTAIPVIPNGVDSERFRPDPAARIAARERLHIAAGTVVIGTVSRLDPVKGHDSLFRAAEVLLQNKFVIQVIVVGDGPERAHLQNYVQQSPWLRGRVSFLGETQDVSLWLNAFDIFALPSLAEGMSNTLLEAMASGVASVTTAVGGNPELIEHGVSGILVPPADVNALVVALKGLFQEPVRAEIGRHARARIEAHFSVQQMLNAYAQMYQAAIAAADIHPELPHAQAAVTPSGAAERPSAMGKAQ